MKDITIIATATTLDDVEAITGTRPDFDVVDDAEAEASDYLVCRRQGEPSPFADNATGSCCACNHPVFFRPHAPAAPARLCGQCVVEMATQAIQ